MKQIIERNICDRCSDEVKEIFCFSIHVGYGEGGPIDKDIDLCDFCTRRALRLLDRVFSFEAANKFVELVTK
jgi:hypothetical protein